MDEEDEADFQDAASVEPLDHSVEVGVAAQPSSSVSRPSSSATSSQAELGGHGGGSDEEDPSQQLLRGVSEPSLVAPPPSPLTPREPSASCCGLAGTLAHFLAVECRAPLLLALAQLALLAQRGAAAGAVSLRLPDEPALAAASAGVWAWLGATLLSWTVCLLLEVRRNSRVAEHGTGAYVSYVIAFKDGGVHMLTARCGFVAVLACIAAVVMQLLEVQDPVAAPTGAELCIGLVLYRALRDMRQSGGSAAFVVDMGTGGGAVSESGSEAFSRARFSRRVLWQHGCCDTARQLSVLIAHGKLRDSLVWSGGYQVDNHALKPGQVTPSELNAKQGGSGADGLDGLDESCEATASGGGGGGAAAARTSSHFSSMGMGMSGGSGGRGGAHKPYRYVSVPGSSAAGARWRVMDECQVYSKSGGSWADAIVTDINVAASTTTVRYRTAQGREMVKTLQQDSGLIRPRVVTDKSAAAAGAAVAAKEAGEGPGLRTPPRNPVPAGAVGEDEEQGGGGGAASSAGRRPVVTFSNGKSPGRRG